MRSIALSSSRLVFHVPKMYLIKNKCKTCPYKRFRFYKSTHLSKLLTLAPLLKINRRVEYLKTVIKTPKTFNKCQVRLQYDI